MTRRIKTTITEKTEGDFQLCSLSALPSFEIKSKLKWRNVAEIIAKWRPPRTYCRLALPRLRRGYYTAVKTKWISPLLWHLLRHPSTLRASIVICADNRPQGVETVLLIKKIFFSLSRKCLRYFPVNLHTYIICTATLKSWL